MARFPARDCFTSPIRKTTFSSPTRPSKFTCCSPDAGSAANPRKVHGSMPGTIYRPISPSSPVYNVTYVTQTSSSADTVESSTAAGYFGMFVIGMTAGLCIGYGTGYYYPPYVYYGGGYPIYRGWPATYGVGAVYSPYR